MGNQTLLQKALSQATRRKLRTDVDSDELELAIAWFDGKIGHTQVGLATGLQRANAASWCAMRLRRAVMGKHVQLIYLGNVRGDRVPA